MAGHQHIPPIVGAVAPPKFHIGMVFRLDATNLGGTLLDHEVIVGGTNDNLQPSYTAANGSAFDVTTAGQATNGINLANNTDYRLRGQVSNVSSSSTAWEIWPTAPITEFSGRTFNFRFAVGFAKTGNFLGDGFGFRLSWKSPGAQYFVYEERSDIDGQNWIAGDVTPVYDETGWVATGQFQSLQTTAPSNTLRFQINQGGFGSSGDERSAWSYIEVEEMV